LRRLRLAAPAQLTLAIPDLVITPTERWRSLPKEAQEAVVSILARMIALGVIEEEEVSAGDVHR
jgi:hypothetical protein